MEKLKALLAALLRKTPPSTGEARAGGGDLSSQDPELGGEAKGTHTHQKRHKSKYRPYDEDLHAKREEEESDCSGGEQAEGAYEEASAGEDSAYEEANASEESGSSSGDESESKGSPSPEEKK